MMFHVYCDARNAADDLDLSLPLQQYRSLHRRMDARHYFVHVRIAGQPIHLTYAQLENLLT